MQKDVTVHYFQICSILCNMKLYYLRELHDNSPNSEGLSIVCRLASLLKWSSSTILKAGLYICSHVPKIPMQLFFIIFPLISSHPVLLFSPIFSNLLPEAYFPVLFLYVSTFPAHSNYSEYVHL